MIHPTFLAKEVTLSEVVRNVLLDYAHEVAATLHRIKALVNTLGKDAYETALVLKEDPELTRLKSSSSKGHVGPGLKSRRKGYLAYLSYMDKVHHPPGQRLGKRSDRET